MFIQLSGDVHPNPGPVMNWTTKSFTFCHANARSICSKSKFDDLLSRNVQNEFDVLTISETWLDNSIANDNLNIDGYDLLRNDRNRQGGGVAVYIRNDIHYKFCDEYSSALHEVIWLRIYFGTTQILFGAFYVPESSAIQATTFIEYLEHVLDQNNQSSALPIVLTGDFNAKSHHWLTGQTNNAMGSKLYDFVQRNNMVQLIKEPTRITETGRSLLDLVITDAHCKNMGYL
jgi:hypothetical protein